MKWMLLQRALGSFLVTTCLVWTVSCIPLLDAHLWPNGMDVEEGRQQLEAIFVDTHGATAVQLPLEKQKAIGPTECTYGLNWGLGTYYTTVYFAIQLQDRDGLKLLRAIQSHWKEKGYKVNPRRLQNSQPELLGASDGFVFRALVVPVSGKVHLTGDTSCLSPVEDSRETSFNTH